MGWILALGLGACAVAPGDRVEGGPRMAAATTSLGGTRWVGVVDAATDHRALPRLEFVAEGRVAGYTGCNMFSGVWKTEDGDVRIGALVMTKRMCLGPGELIEKRFLAVLREGSRGRREGDKLVFTAPDGARFEFVEAAAT